MTNALIGGVLIGIAAVWMYASLGRVAGISGILAQAVKPSNGLTFWAIAFVLGLGVGGWLATLAFNPGAVRASIDPLWLVAGGVIVGVGTRLGSGCTSGHGVCGVARLSKRSLVATLVFVGVGMLSGTLLHGGLLS